MHDDIKYFTVYSDSTVGSNTHTDNVEHEKELAKTLVDITHL